MSISHRAFTAALTQGHRYPTVQRAALQYRTVLDAIIPMQGEIRGYDPDLLDYVFWAAQIKGLSPNTTRVRLDFLHRLHRFAGVPLRDVEPRHLLQFERAAIAGLVAESRRTYTSHLRAFYQWATKTGIISADPTEVLTLPKVPKHLPRPIEEDDLALALDEARPKMRAMIVLGAYAGLRCCEIASMDWSCFRRDPDGNAYLHVRGKGDKDRVVEVGDIVVQALQAYGPKRRGSMFLGQDGAQIHPRSVSRSVNRFLANHGIDATAHQLRHRFGTAIYQLSRDLRMTQEMMGHASPQTTMGYTRPSMEAARRTVQQLDALARTPRARAPLDNETGQVHHHRP